jgi:hypothetical protein
MPGTIKAILNNNNNNSLDKAAMEVIPMVMAHLTKMAIPIPLQMDNTKEGKIRNRPLASIKRDVK